MEVHVVHHNVLVKTGDQQVSFPVKVVLGHDEQSMVFPGVQSAQGGGGEGACPAAAQDFPFLREADIHQFVFVKRDITHLFVFYYFLIGS
jgi:hypothetical protein